MEENVYIDNGDEYEHPKREFENQSIDIRLYCDHDKCNKYVKGVEGYNGGFVAEDGTFVDLRNKCFICEDHRN